MSHSIKKAIITAAGFGSRFLPITKTFPKELLPIIDKPIIQYLVEECLDAGIEEVIIVASPSEVTKFEDYFYGRATSIRTLMIRQDKLDRWDKVEQVFQLPKITIVPQDESLPYGNGRPILTVKDLVSDGPFVAMWGDDLVLSEKSAVLQLLEDFERNPCDGLLAVQEVDDSEVDRYGIIKIKDGTDDQVETVIEKPSLEVAPSNLASYGRYVLTPKIFDYLKGDSTGLDGEIWLQDANDKVAKEGVVRYKVIDGEWMTTGDPLRYMKAHLKFMLAHDKYGPELKECLAKECC
ncbi:MAG: UTP-glucose-1-phosphate uridylyltransferase [Microgenomates bacterium 39_7]|nr:MAG: UTP-glucose-1-phosphate uridylyltransferase [Microgenomates bacterium 39_7]